MNSTLKSNILSFAVYFLGLIVFANFIRSNIFYSNFNLDEVILFFSSRGLDHNLATFDMPKWGSLSEAVYLNRSGGSMDPGVFTLLLRYWSSLSTSTLWLRLLPMSFFCLGGLFLYLGSWNLVEKKSNAIFPLVLLFTSELILEHSFTIRPYSMEAAGYFFFFYLLTLDKIFKVSLIQNFMIVTILMLVLGSRYTVWVGYAAFLLSLIIVNKKLDKKEILLLLILPSIYFVFIYYFSLGYQLKQLPLVYAKSFFLNKTPIFESLKNLSTPLLWMLVSLPLLIFINRKSESIADPYKSISIMALTLLSVFLILDFTGISPFHLSERYTIGIHAFGICSFACVIAKVLNNLKSEFDKYKEVAVLIILIQFARVSLIYEFKQKSDLTPIISYLDNNQRQVSTLYCDTVVMAMLVFLKDFNSYKASWDELPQFEKIDDLRDPKAKYFFVTSVINGVSSADTRIQKMRGFQYLYKGWYQKLYIRNGKLDE